MPRGTREWAGDTEAQTMSVLKKFENSFKSLGVDFGDAVKLTVFLVGDPELDGRMDFSGFMRAYSRYFGTEEQPNKPARSAFQIEALAGGWLVEIEMVLASQNSSLLDLHRSSKRYSKITVPSRSRFIIPTTECVYSDIAVEFSIKDIVHAHVWENRPIALIYLITQTKIRN